MTSARDNARIDKYASAPMRRMVIYNLTLHKATTEMQDYVKSKFIRVRDTDGDSFDSGEAYITKPHHLVVDPNKIHAADQFAVIAEAQIDAALMSKADAVLVGGLTILAYYQISEAFRRGDLKVFVAITRRYRDEDDKFVFNFGGLMEIEPAACVLGQFKE